MKIPHSIATLVSEFTHLNRAPVFNPRIADPCTSEDSAAEVQAEHQTSTPKYKSGERRHSINISVGTDEIPVITVPPKNFGAKNSGCSGPNQKYNKNTRRQSAPCISGIASSTKLREKMEKLSKKSNSVESLKEEN
ncbi:unnamed protein product [Caenorhabditis angaria]|uniref:Uncharacterized protein n=1 Tax=Caenorhabditis angaria TaxID=860376 RepID=A0A9P1N491_9PELO|nr:unnamed protein product [Caenorhabditis angaria]